MNTAHGSVNFFYRKVTKQQQPSFYLIEGGSDLGKNNRQLCDNALRHLAEGDTSLLEEVYHRLKRPVYLLAYAILDDPNLAEDVLQDTFLQVQTRHDRYRPGTNGQAWVFSIARHLAIDRLRTRREICVEALPDQPAPVEDLDGRLDFIRALSLLTEDERQVVVLRLISGLRHGEIAAVTGIREAAARKRYHRAVGKLREYYDRHDEGRERHEKADK